MTLPQDYLERVYAGVLGKIIGVYLGRPFEGWTYEQILDRLGEIHYYVHDRLGVPLVVTDDDISGTFTFLRALPDFGNTFDLTAEQIGQTWLNYLVENRTVLWWGGMGNSTEHTAYLRLKHGIPAPRSGSMALNGRVVAEQIGAQIFIDGWAMVCPGEPDRAAELARRAAQVSHDGEAVFAAQVLAAMEALAFVEADLNRLLDEAVRLIPGDSLIYRLIADLRHQRARTNDWRETLAFIFRHYGYDRYGGNCHVIPNHALIHLGLLYGGDDFQHALSIVNTAGWDTDCNSGNVGCLLGIKNGLAGIDAGPDWRTPVADALYLPTAEGGSCVTDALQVAQWVAGIGCALHGEPAPKLKGGVRFSFDLPGALQGFTALEGAPVRLENVCGHSQRGERALAIHYAHVAPGVPARAATATFLRPDAFQMKTYDLFGCPTLYPGQVVTAEVCADERNAAVAQARLFIEVYDEDDRLVSIPAPVQSLAPGGRQRWTWQIPDTQARPIARVGLEVLDSAHTPGTLYLDWLDWQGAPQVCLTRPARRGQAWQLAWVNAVSHLDTSNEPLRLIQDEGRGLLAQGTLDWRDVEAQAVCTPHLARAFGLAVRVQGLERYYALVLAHPGTARLICRWYGKDEVLAEVPLAWDWGQTFTLSLRAEGVRLTALVDGVPVLQAEDARLQGGAVGLLIEEGRLGVEQVCVRGRQV